MKKRLKMANNAPDNKGRSTGLIVLVLPQEKLNNVDFSDVLA